MRLATEPGIKKRTLRAVIANDSPKPKAVAANVHNVHLHSEKQQ